MSIDDAKDKARELAKTVKTDKQDPREIERQQKEAAAIAKAQQDAATAAAAQAASAAALTMAEVWAAYIEERKPHWGDLHYRDHIDKAKAGGLPSGRRGGGYPPEWWHKFKDTSLAPRLKSITKCVRWSCYAFTTKRLRHGYFSRLGLCLMPKQRRANCA